MEEKIAVSYTVNVSVNGDPILQLRRKHHKKNPEGITLSGHTIKRLQKDDVISLFLVPDQTTVQYLIAAGRAQLSVKLERRF